MNLEERRDLQSSFAMLYAETHPPLQAGSIDELQVHTTGFFSVIGSGFSQEEVERQYDIGQAFFSLSLEEKDKPEYRCDFANGNYFGYRRAHEKRIMDTDVSIQTLAI